MSNLPVDVPTTTHKIEVEKLQTLVEGKVCLELGTFCGHTAIAMVLAGAKRVFSVDNHTGDRSLGETRSLKPFLTYINRYNAWDRIVVLVGQTESIVPELDFMRFDLIFVDADHDYDSVKQDIEMTYPLLNPKGLMVFHDYDPDHEFTPDSFGVVSAVDELIKDKNMKVEDRVSSLLVVRK